MRHVEHVAAHRRQQAARFDAIMEAHPEIRLAQLRRAAARVKRFERDFDLPHGPPRHIIEKAELIHRARRLKILP